MNHEPSALDILEAAKRHYDGVKWSTQTLSQFLIEQATGVLVEDVQEAIWLGLLTGKQAIAFACLDVIVEQKRDFVLVIDALLRALCEP